MDYLKEIQNDLNKATKKLDEKTIEIIKTYSTFLFFQRLRNLIDLKNLENDEVAANILGWAYEELAKD